MSESAEQPTEAEVDAAMRELRHQIGIYVPTRHAVSVVLSAALSVSPLREQVQKLTEENERLRAGLYADSIYPLGGPIAHDDVLGQKMIAAWNKGTKE